MTASPREILKRLFGRGYLQLDEYRMLERALDSRDQLLSDQAVTARRLVEGVPAISAAVAEIQDMLRAFGGPQGFVAAPGAETTVTFYSPPPALGANAERPGAVSEGACHGATVDSGRETVLSNHGGQNR